LDFFNPLPKKPINAEGAGWLSKRLWYRNDQLFFLYSQIGMKTGKTFHVNEAMVPIIQPLLDEECQIKVL
jgi:hypothetical protein